MDIVAIVLIVAVIGILALENVADVLYKPIGRAVLSRLSGGRLPSGDPGWPERFGVALAGLTVLIGGLVLLLWLATLVTR